MTTTLVPIFIAFLAPIVRPSR